MRKAATILGILAGGLTLACSTMTTAVDYDRTTDWSKYKTFMIGTGTPAPTTFTQKRIDSAISSTLSSKGWQAVESNPSIMVYPHVVLSEQTQLNTMNMGGYGYGYGYRGWGGMGGMTTTTVQKIPIGTLVIDLVDPATKEMVWRGQASDQISGKGEDSGKINEAMQKLFENFPPTPGSK